MTSKIVRTLSYESREVIFNGDIISVDKCAGWYVGCASKREFGTYYYEDEDWTRFSETQRTASGSASSGEADWTGPCMGWSYGPDSFGLPFLFVIRQLNKRFNIGNTSLGDFSSNVQKLKYSSSSIVSLFARSENRGQN